MTQDAEEGIKRKRRQNEKKFGQWEELPNGGRRYFYEVEGRMGWKARYVKEVDAKERTLRFYQEIYDERGELVEIHPEVPSGYRTPEGSNGKAEGGGPRMITRKDVAEKLIKYLQHRMTLEELVDWAERTLMEEELEESEVETLREILARLGAADVRAFALTWEDCEEFLKRLGYRVEVQVQEVEQV